ncbi:MAG: methyl-accepting chemotaxis protein, partial [Christensenellales bacterium]
QQIADGASALATGSTEQAATVEEFSSTIAALKEHADQSAKMAVKTQKDIEKVGTLMLEGLDSMDRMTRAMDAIDASSQQIASIIKVIEEIAFKTNILALNAAVEAARAGTHGRGFAVVADEVRNLASQSATAAKETAELIGTSVDHVQSGSAILKETANSIKQLGGIAEANVDQMKRLSELFQRQEQLIADLNAGIDQIAGVVQTNASTAEENAAASQEMSMQSVQLNEIVGRFKIREDNV